MKNVSYPIILSICNDICNEINVTKKVFIIKTAMVSVFFFHLKTSEIGRSLKDSGINQRWKGLTRRHCSRLIKF